MRKLKIIISIVIMSMILPLTTSTLIDQSFAGKKDKSALYCGAEGADPDTCKPKAQVYCEAKDGEWNAKEIACEGLDRAEYDAYLDALCDDPEDAQKFGQICFANEIEDEE